MLLANQFFWGRQFAPAQFDPDLFPGPPDQLSPVVLLLSGGRQSPVCLQGKHHDVGSPAPLYDDGLLVLHSPPLSGILAPLPSSLQLLSLKDRPRPDQGCQNQPQAPPHCGPRGGATAVHQAAGPAH
jgi:hypothetical protein